VCEERVNIGWIRPSQMTVEARKPVFRNRGDRVFFVHTTRVDVWRMKKPPIKTLRTIYELASADFVGNETPEEKLHRAFGVLFELTLAEVGEGEPLNLAMQEDKQGVAFLPSQPLVDSDS